MPGQETDRDVLREWARKSYLRSDMRVEALSVHELRILDDRLARWQADRQLTGRVHMPRLCGTQP